MSRSPLSLRPAPRATRQDEKRSAAAPKVKQLFDEEGAKSPSMKDLMRRRVGVNLYEEMQAVIIYSTYAALYALFLQRFPQVAIGFALFKALRPWYIKHIRHQTCLCQSCTNFKNYQEMLLSLPALFEPIMHPPTQGAEPDGPQATSATSMPADEWSRDPDMLRLMEFCSCRFKSDMVKKVTCNNLLCDARLQCIFGECSKCGFGPLIWSKKY